MIPINRVLRRRNTFMEEFKEYVYQLPIRDYIENGLGNEIMTPVHGQMFIGDFDIFYQSYLISKDSVSECMEKDTCDFTMGSLMPGFTRYGYGDEEEIIYSRFNNNKNVEPLVIQRDFNGLANNTIELLEEFRLLNNLCYIISNNQYKDLKNNNVVVSIKDNNLVYVNKQYLKNFLSVKNMMLVLNFDSRCNPNNIAKTIYPDSLDYRNENTFYTLNIGIYDRKPYSLLMGKKLIAGCALSECGYWPYDKAKQYIDFIVGVDENGNEILHTCDPDKLSNYFGANPNAPHYLTPVFFEKDVLNKYYSKPEIYSVEDSIIRCGTLWALYIDNQNKEYVSAYLGDLGRDLPSEKEQLYWKSYNKALDGKLSATKYARDFMAQFTNPEAMDLIFKQKYIRINNRYKSQLGWQLFLDLEKRDQYNFEHLRIPVNNSIVEMDMLTLSLVKVLIDSLNEKEITAQLTGSYEKLTGSISKLEVWFQEKNIMDYQEHIQFLRNLQNLRSSGTGHRKGKNYEKISKIFDLNTKNYADVFEDILKQAVLFLDYMDSKLL